MAEKPFSLCRPQAHSNPVVFNSPHSGRNYSPAFIASSRLSTLFLRRSEDCYVDELFADVPRLGSVLLKAGFARAYLDVNREPYELDAAMFKDRLPAYVNTSSRRVAGGLGTIARIVSEGYEIYRDLLSFDEARARIEACYFPYHDALEGLIEDTYARFGAVILVDCHSMPSSASLATAAATARPPDIILGDRFASSCASEITGELEHRFRQAGLRVVRNRPYAGGFITRKYGNPGRRRHAIQIEINRDLYLNERTLQKTADFAHLSAIINSVMARFVDFSSRYITPGQIAAE